MGRAVARHAPATIAASPPQKALASKAPKSSRVTSRLRLSSAP